MKKMTQKDINLFYKNYVKAVGRNRLKPLPKNQWADWYYIRSLEAYINEFLDIAGKDKKIKKAFEKYDHEFILEFPTTIQDKKDEKLQLKHSGYIA